MARSDGVLGKKGACVIPATLEYNVTLLHQFLFGDEVYTPTDAVKKISNKIASDTGVYKEGQVVNHVSTEGHLPKETKAPETTAETEATTETVETIVETDENGNEIIKESSSTVESSSTYPSIGETDENGNLVNGQEEDESEEIGSGIPTKPTPGESSSADAGGVLHQRADRNQHHRNQSRPKPNRLLRQSLPLPGSGEVSRSSFSTLKQRKWRYPDSRPAGRKHQQSGWAGGDEQGYKNQYRKDSKDCFSGICVFIKSRYGLRAISQISYTFITISSQIIVIVKNINRNQGFSLQGEGRRIDYVRRK